MQDPPIWQRVLAALAYLLPWSDAFSFGRGLFGLFPALQWLGVPILPIALLEQAVPFGGLVLFFIVLNIFENFFMSFFFLLSLFNLFLNL